MQQNKIPDGQRTKVIYTLIKDAKYQDVPHLISRPSTTSAMNCSSVQEVDPCPFLPTATTWARISSIQLESMNSSPNSTRKSQNTNFTSPKVTTKMEISNRLWKLVNQLAIQTLSKRSFFCNPSSDMSRMRFSMPNHCFVKVGKNIFSQPRFRYHRQLRMHSLQGGKILRGQAQICWRHEWNRIWLRNCIQHCSLPLQAETASSFSQIHCWDHRERS